MTKTVGIAGAGILGRLMALELRDCGWKVTIFDSQGPDEKRNCSFAAAGMLSPYCELEQAPPLISELGIASLEIWPQVLRRIQQPVFFERRGSLVVAHPNDIDELQRLCRCIQQMKRSEIFQLLDSQALSNLEPELDERFHTGVYLPFEGQIDNAAVLDGLQKELETRAVGRYWNERVKVLPHKVISPTDTHTFDWVIDCRGLGAKESLSNLRGVRGEMLRLHAPEVRLTRPVRLMHPRYPLYIVPRPDSQYLVGATCIESEDFRPVTVRSALELLSAAFVVHPGFAEACVIETITQCRPAFSDNLPRIRRQPGLMQMNGLYRHGFLISPKLVQLAVAYLEGKPAEEFPIWEEAA